MNKLKELKDRLSKINELLDRLDEKLVQGDITSCHEPRIGKIEASRRGCMRIAKVRLLF